MNFPEAIFLAILQGITEWLPISSSGHLLIAQKLLNIDAPVSFDAALHFGTLLSVLAYMRKELCEIACAIVKPDLKSENGRLGVYVIIATIPAAAAGLLLKKHIEYLFTSLSAVAAGLLFTGLLLFISRKHIKSEKVTGRKSLIVGLMQAVAITPGVSRSGSTISTALILGIERKSAAKFSFLLSVPVILGATVLQAKDLFNSNLDITMVGASIIVSAAVGYASIRLLWKTILEEKFHLFAFYCWAAGLALVLLQIL